MEDIFLMLKKYLGAFQITSNDGTSILCTPQSESLFPRHNMCLKHSESLSRPQSTLYAKIVSCSCKQERGQGVRVIKLGTVTREDVMNKYM